MSPLIAPKMVARVYSTTELTRITAARAEQGSPRDIAAITSLWKRELEVEPVKHVVEIEGDLGPVHSFLGKRRCPKLSEVMAKKEYGPHRLGGSRGDDFQLSRKLRGDERRSESVRIDMPEIVHVKAWVVVPDSAAEVVIAYLTAHREADPLALFSRHIGEVVKAHLSGSGKGDYRGGTERLYLDLYSLEWMR